MIAFRYDEFVSDRGLAIYGDASVNVNNGIDSTKVLRLTPAQDWKEGFAKYPCLVPVVDFSTEIKFRLTNGGGVLAPSGSYGGDGFSLIFYRDRDPAMVDQAGALGSAYLKKYLIFEVDLWKNNANPDIGDLSSNHVGISVYDGNGIFHYSQAAVSQQMNDGNLHSLGIRHKRGWYEMSVDGAVQLTGNVSISDQVGGYEANMGLFGATGGAHENHDIISWFFESFRIRRIMNKWPRRNQPAQASMFGCNT